MGPGVHWAFPIVSGLAAPENDMAFVIHAFEFHPAIKGIHRAAGKEVSHVSGSHNDFNARCLPPPQLSGAMIFAGGAAVIIEASRPRADSSPTANMVDVCGPLNAAREASSDWPFGSSVMAKMSTVTAPFRNFSTSFICDVSPWDSGTAVLAATKRCECT